MPVYFYVGVLQKAHIKLLRVLLNSVDFHASVARYLCQKIPHFTHTHKKNQMAESSIKIRRKDQALCSLRGAKLLVYYI